MGQVTGTSSQAGEPAVIGSNSATDGVAGQFDGKVNVQGNLSAFGTAPANAGTIGGVNGSGGAGVLGLSTNSSSFGVSGVNNSAWPCIAVIGSSSNGHGVKGTNGNGSGTTPKAGCGVWGDSTEGYGVYATSSTHNGLFGSSKGNDGVHGETTSQAHYGVSGLNNSAWPCIAVLGSSENGHGVKGINVGASGKGSGTTPKAGCGVWGDSDQGFGIFGASATQFGVFGTSADSDGVHGLTNSSGPNCGVYGESLTSSGFGVSGVNNQTWPCIAVLGSSNNGHGVKGINGAGSGTTPNAGCGVWGDSAQGIGVYGASQSGTAGWFDGNVSVTGTVNVSGDVVLAAVHAGGGDCAERFDLKQLEAADPGSVMVIDESGALRLCDIAYDRKVAGVVSGAGALKPGIVLDQNGGDEGRTTIALVGKVYCKVDADYGPIAVGDLLTSSETPGHAMRVTDPMKGFGSVIGKALGAKASGRGLLSILVALQ